MNPHTPALAGADGKGDWTARIEDGEPIYRHVSGFETSEREVVEQSLRAEVPGGGR